MICTACNYYAPISRSNLIAPRCDWRPTSDQLLHFQAVLPSPTYSRLLILSTPVDVNCCPQFVQVAP